MPTSKTHPLAFKFLASFHRRSMTAVQKHMMNCETLGALQTTMDELEKVLSGIQESAQ